MRQKTATIYYTDGREDTVNLTARAQCKAEEHAQVSGWGAAEDCKIRFIFYYVYAAARMAGITAMPYEQWLDTVADVNVNVPDAAEGDAVNPTV